MARFTRTVPAPQVRNPYEGFRPYVRQDFERCCAYCLMHEFWAHGESNFQLDHFRPKDSRLFPELKNEYSNIYYACSVCNRNKSNHWPSPELQQNGVGFVDLCANDFAEHYTLLEDGTLEAATESARYTIRIIRLNHPDLVQRAGGYWQTATGWIHRLNKVFSPLAFSPARHKSRKGQNHAFAATSRRRKRGAFIVFVCP